MHHGHENPDKDALPIRANARVMGATLPAGQSLTLGLDPSRHIYLVAARGVVEAGGLRLNPRDGAAITDIATLEILGLEDAELILVDAA